MSIEKWDQQWTEEWRLEFIDDNAHWENHVRNYDQCFDQKFECIAEFDSLLTESLCELKKSICHWNFCWIKIRLFTFKNVASIALFCTALLILIFSLSNHQEAKLM